MLESLIQIDGRNGETKPTQDGWKCFFSSFISNKQSCRTPERWHYVPFNGGPRTCVGQQFALTEMSYVLARMFQQFGSVEPRQTVEQYKNCDIVISPGAGVLVSFKPAGSP